MLLQKIIADIEREIDRLHHIREVVASLAAPLPIVPISTELHRKKSRARQAPRSVPKATSERSGIAVPEDVPLLNARQSAAISIPDSSKPVVISAADAALARAGRVRSPVIPTPESIPGTLRDGTLDALVRELAQRPSAALLAGSARSLPFPID